MIRPEPAPVGWLEALVESDAVFTARFAIAVVEGWAGFPEAVPHALEEARNQPGSTWATHLFFDDDIGGALVGFGGWKSEPVDGYAELGYAVAPRRQGRGVATAAVRALIAQAPNGVLDVVVAHTLAEESASTAVPRRCGFAQVGDVSDPEVGTIWRWELELTAH